MLNWLIPAITTVTSGLIGGAKHKADMKQYYDLLDKDKKRRLYAAWTGYKGSDVEKPSGARSVFGGMLTGAKTGINLASGLKGLGVMGSGGSSNLNPYQVIMNSPQENPYSLGSNYNDYFKNAMNWSPLK